MTTEKKFLSDIPMVLVNGATGAIGSAHAPIGEIMGIKGDIYATRRTG
ncbi:MAG: hypothetical protein ACMUJM_19065 [bacterium]